MNKPGTANSTGAGLRSAAAVSMLLAVVVGFPMLLAAAVGWPLPHTVPTLQQLQDTATSALAGSVVIKVLACGAWLAWAHFTVCVLAEVRAELTGRELHVPLGGLNRQLANRLVTTALLASTLAGAGTGTGGLTAANASVIPAVLSTTATTVASSLTTDTIVTANGLDRTATSTGVANPTPTSSASSTALPASSSTTTAGKLVYVVQPPHRGYVDNLWDIAQRHLGDGRRWREIYAFNEGQPQPTGGTLTDPDIVRVGWQLRMPADAHDLPDSTTPQAATAPTQSADPAQPASRVQQRTYTVRAGDTLRSVAQELLGDETRTQELFDANRDRTQPDGGHLVHADLIRPGWVLLVPSDSPAAAAAPTPARTSAPIPAAPAAPAPAPATPRADEPSAPTPTATTATRAPSAPAASPASPAAPAQSAPGGAADTADSDDSIWVRTAEGIGGLLAGFVLVLLARRRTAQEGARKPGQRVPLPTGSAETTELELRAVEDPIAIAEFDLALRQLAASQHQTGQPLPEVRAARITASTVELYLVQPAEAPAPWVSSGATAGLWTMHREQLRAAEPDERDGQLPAPYPALVTVGQDDEAGHVLVDLEQISSLGVTGAGETTHAVLTAIALELASSTWAQEVDLTLVGLCPELPDALPDRTGQLRHAGSLEQLIGELERRADVVSAGLQGAGLDSPRAARGRGRAPDAWAPEIVLFAEPVPDALWKRLDQVLQRLPRVGIAAVTGAGTPLGEWALRVQADGRAVLQPAGLAVTVQQIPADKYNDVLRQLAVSVQPAVAGPAWAAALPDRELRVADLPEQPLVEQPEQPAQDLRDETVEVAEETALTDESPADGGSVRVDVTGEFGGLLPPTGDVGELPAVPHRADALALDSGAHPAAEPGQSDVAAGDGLAPQLGSVVVVDEQQAVVSEAEEPLVIDVRQQQRAGGHGPAALPAAVAVAPATDDGNDLDRAGNGQEHVVVAGSAEGLTGEAGVAQVVPVDEAVGGATGAADRQLATTGTALVGIGGDRDGQLAVPRIRLLGDVAVRGTRGPEPITRKDGKVTGNVTYRAAAMIVYLALNPGAVQWDVMSERLSPNRRWTAKTVGTVTRAARIWLGGDEDGPFFPPFAGSGDYRLRADVRTDWHEWLDLVGQDVTSTPTAQLDEALALVQGAPFGNIKNTPNYYAWAEPIRLEMVSSIVDVSHEVVRRVLLSRDQPGGDLPATSRGRAALARRAVRVGRLVDAGSELMFRDALLIEHRTGNAAVMRQLAHQVVQHAEDLDSDLEPETEQLLSDLKVHAR